MSRCLLSVIATIIIASHINFVISHKQEVSQPVVMVDCQRAQQEQGNSPVFTILC